MENKLTIYNTLTRRKELFVPLHAPHVGMYVCGPTVYGDAHLGHARPAITFDILFRYLTHLGYKVRYVRNITDVGHLEHDADDGEDKIAKKARLEQLEPMEVVQYYLNRYHKAMEALNVLPPSIEPHASGHIIEQIQLVEEILKNGYAYESQVIGLKYSAIIAAGSFLIWLLVVPVVGSTATGAGMSPEELYQTFGRPLGIGGIAMAGLIGIIRQSGIIKQAMGLAVSEFSGKKKAETNVPRTQRDLTMRTILTTLIAALATTFFFFQFGILGNWGQTAVALLIVFVISFLFTTVAANAIAIVGSNPVSGMTLMTLILASLVLVSIGLNGTAGMTAALIIGGVVCTALSTAGGFITDLKIGYWIGTTPKKQESWKFLGVFVSAATVAGVMIILNKTYGFGPGSPLEAPQANAMAAVIQPLMQGGTAPWVLYFCGAVLALVLTGIGIPALPFALGMFLPLQLNLPLLIGGLIAWFVSTRSKDQALNKARMSQGTLIASGFIAGGALMGVVGAILKFADVDWKLTQWNSSNAASWVGLGMYLALIIYFAVHSLRAKKEE